MASPFPGMDPSGGDVLSQVYRRAAYARRLDYTTPVPPLPLRPAMQQWVTAHLPQPRGARDYA
ncbi:MAG: hypothetical protein AB7N91_18605 [Candidatus Tectimicrobiota bacterium]